MAEVDVHKVVVSRSKAQHDQWRATSYGANGEAIAWTENYADKRDAEAAALTIAAGATIEVEDSEGG